MKVECKYDCVEITTEEHFYRIREITEMYLICDRVKWLLNNSPDEKSHHIYRMALDVFLNAKSQLILNQTKSCPYLEYSEETNQN